MIESDSGSSIALLYSYTTTVKGTSGGEGRIIIMSAARKRTLLKIIILGDSG